MSLACCDLFVYRLRYGATAGQTKHYCIVFAYNDNCHHIPFVSFLWTRKTIKQMHIFDKQRETGTFLRAYSDKEERRRTNNTSIMDSLAVYVIALLCKG